MRGSIPHWRYWDIRAVETSNNSFIPTTAFHYKKSEAHIKKEIVSRVSLWGNKNMLYIHVAGDFKILVELGPTDLLSGGKTN